MRLNQHIAELREAWDFTTEELDHIKIIMAEYAVETWMDSEIRIENEEFLKEINE